MALSFCPKCGAERLPEARFCGVCGFDYATLSDVPETRSAATRRPQQGARSARQRARLAGAIVVVVVLLAAVGGAYVIGRLPGSNAGGAGVSQPPQSAGTVAPTATPYVYQGVFTPTASMTVGRGGATATLLRDGRVLIAGGSGVGVLASAELYDPVTGTFRGTGSMGASRFGDTATLLTDGQVLVAGGNDCQGHLFATAELYDPASGMFTPTGSMIEPRAGATATLLADGQVLIAGGSADSALASAELYDPATGSFRLTGSMTAGRIQAFSILLRDGHVLVAGGLADNAGSIVLASAELYDPAAGTFSQTGPMEAPRIGAAVTSLAEGRVLVAGGWSGSGLQTSSSPASSTAEYYEPATGQFTPTGSMEVGRAGAAAVLLPAGQVLVAGGWSGPVASSNVDAPALMSAELYR